MIKRLVHTHLLLKFIQGPFDFNNDCDYTQEKRHIHIVNFKIKMKFNAIL